MKKPKKEESNASLADVVEMLRDIINLVDRRFNLLENKVGAVQIGVERSKEELRQHIEGLGMRIDDLALHRAKYSDIEILQKEIADIRRRLELTARPKR